MRVVFSVLVGVDREERQWWERGKGVRQCGVNMRAVFARFANNKRDKETREGVCV